MVGSGVDEAIADIRATFEGSYGPYWAEASPVAVVDDEPLGAIMTVSRAPWPDVADSAFIVELFVDHRYRRRGVARALLGQCLRVAVAAGEKRVGLRVSTDNVAAVALYRSFGFSDARRLRSHRRPG